MRPFSPALRSPLALPALLAWSLLSCGKGDAPEPDDGVEEAAAPAPAVAPPAPVLRRLTVSQYERSLRDLLGEGVVLPNPPEPDSTLEGLYATGASVSTISALGAQKFEEAAYNLAAQVMDDPTLREPLVPCVPAATRDDACAAQSLEALGHRAWRRPLSADELATLVAISGTAAETLGDFYDGLEFGFAGLLQSPYFLYRIELGEDDGAGGRRYTGYEMASRLSYLLWDTTPDAALLAAAASGDLVTEAGVAAQVDRLVADPRHQEGVRTFFTEMLALYELDHLSKDVETYRSYSDDVGALAKEETLMVLDDIIFTQDGDYRRLLDAEYTFVDRKLAALYNVRAPEREGFGRVELPRSGGRRGLVGQMSFLAANAHAASSSATLRGKAMRVRLLCQNIPPPPSNVDASIPEATADDPTLRDRIAVHLEDPVCAGCHNVMDPIGLGLENFDGLGMWRLTENDVTIDPSGELDGVPFTDAWELAGALADHNNVGPCLSRTLFRYAEGRAPDAGEEAHVDWLSGELARKDHRVSHLLRTLATSAAFRTAGTPEVSDD